MKKKQAFNLSIKYLEKALRQLAFDANLFFEGIRKDGHFERTAKEYNRVKEAIEIMKREVDDDSIE